MTLRVRFRCSGFGHFQMGSSKGIFQIVDAESAHLRGGEKRGHINCA